MTAKTKRRTSWRRGKKRVLLLIAINVFVLLLTFLGAELSIRVYRLRGFSVALASLFSQRPMVDTPKDNWVLPDEELGYRLNENDESINALSFLGPEIERPKPEGAFRILTLGDSVGYAPEGFFTMVRERLAQDVGSHVELWNACVPGYTAHQEVLFLERLVDEVEPDLVLFQYCLNDNHEFLHLIGAEGAFLMTKEARAAWEPPGDGWLAAFGRWSYVVSEIRRYVYKRSRAQAERDPWPWQNHPEFSAAWRGSSWDTIVIPAYERAHAFLEPVPVPLAVLAMPFEPQLDPELLERDAAFTCYPQERLRACCESLGVPFLDLHGTLQPHRTETLYTDRIHLTARGHQLVAQRVIDWLRAERLVPGFE